MNNSRKRHHEVLVTQPQRLHYGLYNQGNTCYLNSVLQVLFTTTDFHDRLNPKSKFTDKELRKVFEKLNKTTCGTETIAKAFEIKNVNQQSDAAECLQLILQKVSPRASEVFQGELTYSTKCSEGHIINDETNPFWTLPLPLKDAQDSTFSVEEGFERIFKTKRFSGDNMVYCNECERKTEATSGCEMTEFPPNLILLLKRFDMDYSTMSYFKSDCCVEVPRVLQTKNKTYKLYGMVNHMGSIRGGHYTATVMASEDNTWVEFNDDRVQKVEPFAQTSTHDSRTAYLLLYRASASQRDERGEVNDETGHLDQQMGHEVENKRQFRESAGVKENRPAQYRKERDKESLRYPYREEKRHSEHGRNVSSFTRYQHSVPAEEDAVLLEKQTYSSNHHPDDWTKPDTKIEMGRIVEGEEPRGKMSNSRKRHHEVEFSSERRRQKVTQPQRLHYGLYNQGNTCYLNSVLQVLFMTTDFHDRLDPKSKFTDKELRKVFEKLNKTTCGTETIAKAFEIKNVNQQSDAAECLQLILQKVSPRASEVFQGELTYSTKCSEGHIINDETNPFWTLPLPLKDAQDSTFSVEEGFERIFKTKRFSGDNMVYCNECERKTEATSGCEMTEFPPNLILLLKRFDMDYSTMSYFKSDCCVEVPRVLQTKNKTYKLYGMVNHMGSIRGGHYTATVMASEDNTWVELNDDRVKKVEPFAQTSTHDSRTAYLLLYRASASQRDERGEVNDETGHLDQQMGNKVEHKRRIRESARVKENRPAHYGKGRDKDSFRYPSREEKHHSEHGRNVSSFTRDQYSVPAEEDAVLLKKQPYSSNHHPDDWTKPDTKIKMGRIVEDVDPARPCKRLHDILKNPFVIGAIAVVGVVAIAVILLPILLPYRPTTIDRVGNP